MKKKPRFFCDHCGSEVGAEVKSCPHCGRFFASVRCPSCGYSGHDRMFQNGCPMCGYSAPPENTSKQRKKKLKNTSSSANHLPFWTYAAAAIIILAVISLISYFITR